ncbi:hypothetical protein PY32053_00761 [Paracoccus yeei]|uniref:Uncharacterized protein n=1 Tax=Paracoccus yeei TaxID=147645 RepID=A0A386UIY9_9RHOB|nr:hypothetical protein [Paracoccus yeei]AYF00436.1 hypothetical protein PY32053_00761 [Paracoccus yeei]AZV00442.1 hypothetical protein pyei1_p25 [Paracoccus phage vB_PyeM_Pyei1]
MSAPATVTPGLPSARAFGRIRVAFVKSDMIEMIRVGAPGVGRTRRELIWGRDNMQNALIAAQRRKGADAEDQAKALRWALEVIGHE